MADLNIHDFYRDAARILVLLYNSFPRPVILYVEDITGPDEPDEFGLPSPRAEAGLAAMLWLAREGYIHYEQSIRQEALDQTVLTERGFLLLASSYDKPHEIDDTLPPSLQHDRQTGAALLRRTLKKKDSAYLQTVILSLLGGHLSIKTSKNKTANCT